MKQIFNWPDMKILDLVDCTDKKVGSWETLDLLYHFSFGGVLKKIK